MRTSRIVRRIAAGDTGFGSEAYGRTTVGTTSSSAFVVRTMIGVDCSAGLDRSHPIASRPGTSRSCTSTRTRSGGLSRAATTAAMPLSTASAANPELSRASRHSCSVAESAPTTSARRGRQAGGSRRRRFHPCRFYRILRAVGGRGPPQAGFFHYRSRLAACIAWVIEGRIGSSCGSVRHALVGISSFWQVRVIDRPQMPACPARTALGAATETYIKRPFAIKAKRLKRMFRPGGFHGEFRPIAAGLAYFIHCCFHGRLVPPFQGNDVQQVARRFERPQSIRSVISGLIRRAVGAHGRNLLVLPAGSRRSTPIPESYNRDSWMKGLDRPVLVRGRSVAAPVFIVSAERHCSAAPNLSNGEYGR